MLRTFILAAATATILDTNETEAIKKPLTDKGDNFKTLEQMANEYGFLTEKHQVTTQDGYILSLYRIPGAISKDTDRDKRPIFLMHALATDHMIWVDNNH